MHDSGLLPLTGVSAAKQQLTPIGLQQTARHQQICKNYFFADFLPETAHIRNDPTWQGAPPAPGLVDRRVEITGPVDRKMVINALNSGSTQYMADFEGKLCASAKQPSTAWLAPSNNAALNNFCLFTR